MKRNKTKRLATLLVALSLTLSFVSVGAWAAEAPELSASSVTSAEQEPDGGSLSVSVPAEDSSLSLASESEESLPDNSDLSTVDESDLSTPDMLIAPQAFGAAVSVDSVAALQTALNSLGGLGGDFVLTPALAADFAANPVTINLPLLNAGEVLSIDGAGIALDNSLGRAINHFKAATGNLGTYTIQNISLNGKGGIVYTTGTAYLDNITLSNIRGTSVYGFVTAIAQKSTRLTVTNSTFRDCGFAEIITGGDQPLVVENSTFTSFTNPGRAIGGSKGSVTVNNSLFKDLPGVYGAGVNAGTGAVTVTNSSFINVTNYGMAGYPGGTIAGHKQKPAGGITVENCYFEGNVGIKYGGAVSLYYYDGNWAIRNSYFVNNSQSMVKGGASAEDGTSDGGAVAIFNPAGYTTNFDISGNTFADNFAQDDGGAIFMEGRDYAVKGTIRNNTFVSNKGLNNINGDSGGAIQLSLRVDATLVNNTFYNNSKVGLAGAVGEHSNPSTLEYPKATFQNNIFAANFSTLAALNQNFAGIFMTNATNAGGNIGYDNTTDSLPAISLTSLFGTETPALNANTTSITAGATLNGSTPVFIPTLMVTDLLSGTTDPIYRAGVGTPGDGTVPAADQRGFSRRTPTAPGAVEAPLPPTYTVTFDTLGGSTVAPITDIGAGALITAPADPARSGFSFGGWFRESSVTTPWNFSADRVNSDLTLYAKWTVNPTPPPPPPPPTPSSTPSSSSSRPPVSSSSSSSSSSTSSTSSSSSSSTSSRPTSSSGPVSSTSGSVSSTSSSASISGRTVSSSSSPSESSSSTAPVSSIANNGGDNSTPLTPENVAQQREDTRERLIEAEVPTVQIGNTQVPLFGGGEKFTWSLVSLLLAIAGFVIAVALVIRFILTRNQRLHTTSMLFEIASIVLGVLSCILFFVFYNLNSLMVFMDAKTILFALLLAGELATFLVSRIKERYDVMNAE